MTVLFFSMFSMTNTEAPINSASWPNVDTLIFVLEDNLGIQCLLMAF